MSRSASRTPRGASGSSAGSAHRSWGLGRSRRAPRSSEEARGRSPSSAWSGWTRAFPGPARRSRFGCRMPPECPSAPSRRTSKPAGSPASCRPPRRAARSGPPAGSSSSSRRRWTATSTWGGRSRSPESPAGAGPAPRRGARGGGPIETARITGGRGTVTLRDVRGDVLANTVAGPITVTGARITRAHLETVSGAISYEGDVDGRGTLEAVTHAGDVTLRLPAAIAAEFELQTFAGRIETTLFPKGNVQHQPRDGSPWTFATGGGGAQVTVRAFKGMIRVLKR